MKSPFQILDPFRVKAFLYQLIEEPTLSAVDFPSELHIVEFFLSFVVFNLKGYLLQTTEEFV